MRNFFQHLIDARMHAGDCVQLACVLAIYAPRPDAVEPTGLNCYIDDYWSFSCDRLDRWNFFLPSLTFTPSTANCGEDDPKYSRASALESMPTSGPALVTEMIVSEPVSRIWAAILLSDHQIESENDSDNFAHRFKNPSFDILNQHRELLQKIMGELNSRLPDPKTCDVLHKLLRRTQRWTDLLLAHIEQSHPVSRFAPDPKRCLDFAEDLQSQLRCVQGRHTAALTIAAARRAICKTLTDKTFSPELNYKIGASILQSFPAQNLEAVGLLNALGTVRLLDTFTRCEQMLDEILEDRTASMLFSA